MSLPMQYFFKSNDNLDQLYDKEKLLWKNYSIWNLGIQGPPGLKFYLNTTTPFIIGSSGVYEVNCWGYNSINGSEFYFDANSVNDLIKNNPQTYLLIDIYPYQTDNNIN